MQVHPGRLERVLRLLTVGILDTIFRLKTYGTENIPTSGAFLFCPNHSSNLDPFFHARGQRRLLRFMAKDTMFKYPVMRWISKHGGGFPVRRGKGDTFAMEVAKAILLDGQPVTIYPEGTRYRSDEQLGKPKSGAARLVLETGVVVIPAASYGAKPRSARGETGIPWKLPKVTTVYGQPLSFPKEAASEMRIAEVRDEIWSEVQRMYDLAKALHSTRPRRFEVPVRGTAHSSILTDTQSTRGGAVR